MKGKRKRNLNRLSLLRLAQRARIRQFLLNIGQVERIHIIGAARSGTTMLHCAMAAFQNTIINSRESSTTWDPGISDCACWAAGRLFRKAPIVFVTKRNYGWFRADHLHELLDDVIAGNIGLINIVRDPRDSLTSRHAGKLNQDYYLEPERWQASITAGDWLNERLEAHPRKITLRYEDLIFHPAATQAALESQFSLTLREGITDWSKLSKSIANMNLTPSLRTALHQVRDFDERSVGKWKHDPRHVEYFQRILDGRYGEALRKFMKDYNYFNGSELAARNLI